MKRKIPWQQLTKRERGWLIKACLELGVNPGHIPFLSAGKLATILMYGYTWDGEEVGLYKRLAEIEPEDPKYVKRFTG